MTDIIKNLWGDNYLINKGNALIGARYPKMSIQEMRILGLAAAQIKKNDKEFQSILIPKAKVEEGAKFEDLKKLSVIIQKRVVVLLDTDKQYQVVSLVAFCDVKKNASHFQVDFHPKMAEQLLELRNNFTQIPEWVLLGLPCFYSLRLYEILKMHKGMVEGIKNKTGNHTDYKEVKSNIKNGLEWRISYRVNITDLHEMLGISKENGKSYLIWGNLNLKILQAAQEHFKDHSDFLFDFEGGRHFGKAFTFVDFVIRNNESPVQLDLFTALAERENGNSLSGKQNPAPEELDDQGESVDDLLGDTDPAQPIIDINPIDSADPKPFGESNPTPPPTKPIKPTSSLSAATQVPQEIIDMLGLEIWSDPVKGCQVALEETLVEQGEDACWFYADYVKNYKSVVKTYGGLIRGLRRIKLYEKYVIKEEERELKAQGQAEIDKKAAEKAEKQAMEAMRKRRLENQGKNTIRANDKRIRLAIENLDEATLGQLDAFMYKKTEGNAMYDKRKKANNMQGARPHFYDDFMESREGLDIPVTDLKKSNVNFKN